MMRENPSVTKNVIQFYFSQDIQEKTINDQMELYLMKYVSSKLTLLH